MTQETNKQVKNSNEEDQVEIAVEEFDLESCMDMRAFTENTSNRWVSNRVSYRHSGTGTRTMSRGNHDFNLKKKKFTM